MPKPFPAGPPSLLRAINERAVLELVANAGPLTRAQVAELARLSKPTVSAALAHLAERRVVVEEGRVVGRKGPAANLYRVAPDSYLALGIDIGTHWVRAALRNAWGVTAAEVTEPTPSELAEIAPTVRTLAEKVAADAGVTFEDITAIVVGLPGVVGADGRQLDFADGLPESGEGLGHLLAAALGDGVVLENDINLASLVEHTTGAAVGVDDFVLLGLGTGVGMGVMLGGRLHRGGRGISGEVGYLPSPVDPGDLPRRGRVDDILGSARILAMARSAGLGDVTARDVFDLARSGDERALGVVDDTASGLAWVIACVIPVLDPSLVVLGGAIGTNGDLLLEPVRRHLAGLTGLTPDIVTSAHGAQATLLGALERSSAIARERAFTAATTPG